MGSLNALNARPHDDGFLNPCRRTSKVFCKTHLGLRKLSSSGGGYDGRVKAKRLKESPLSIDVGLALPALAWSRKWTEKTNLVLGNVQKSHLNG